MSLLQLSPYQSYFLPHPLNFPCIVAGKLMVARLDYIEHNFIQFVYHVSFSDGHATYFINAEDSHWGKGGWGSPTVTQEYARAIKDDLEAIAHHDFTTAIFCFSYTLNRKDINIWVLESRRKPEDQYFIYYKGELQLILNQWDNGFAVETPDEKVVNSDQRAIANQAIERIKAELKAFA